MQDLREHTPGDRRVERPRRAEDQRVVHAHRGDAFASDRAGDPPAQHVEVRPLGHP